MRLTLAISVMVAAAVCCRCAPLFPVSPRQACLNAGLSDAETDALTQMVAGLSADIGALSQSDWRDFVEGLCVATDCSDAEFTCLFLVGTQELVR